MKKRSLCVSIAMAAMMLFNTPLTTLAADNNDDYLHTDGSKILDANGNEVRLTGIAWFGNETPDYSFHGIWANTPWNILDTVANNGFNILRVPLSVELVDQWRQGKNPMPSSINDYLNPDLKGKNSLELLDMVIAYCKKVGMKVMLDMHRISSGGQTPTWYTGNYTAEDFENCWAYLADHYKNDDTVVAADVFNEPHGKSYQAGESAKWDGSTDKNNWKYEAEKVGEKILDINPNLLVVVEGVETYPKEGLTYDAKGISDYYGTWWGGNLRGVKDFPVNPGKYKNQIVYSPHDYGPGVSAQSWFEGDFTKDSLTRDVWRPNWLYLKEKNIAPVLVGEWGGNLDGANNEKWMRELADSIKENNLNHTFWCVNPNSGDTGGILGYDFKTVDKAKMDLVRPTLWQDSNGKFIGLDHKVNLGANGTHVAGTPETPETPVMIGDVNGDGNVNILDVMKLNNYLLDDSTKINEKNSDINGDGSISILDLIALKTKLNS